MSSRTLRYTVALLCVVTVLLLAISAGGAGLPAAVLSPFWVVVAVLLPLALRPERPDPLPSLAPCLDIRPSRAPPAR